MPRVRGWGSLVIVDRAIYRDGERITPPDSLAELNGACHSGAGIAWIGLYRPDAREFAAVAHEFDLHELAVEDAVKAHQRPKLERYGDALFLVLRPARYVEESDRELHPRGRANLWPPRGCRDASRRCVMIGARWRPG
jgi:Mg2+ and Co2+ transporter CorA